MFFVCPLWFIRLFGICSDFGTNFLKLEKLYEDYLLRFSWVIFYRKNNEIALLWGCRNGDGSHHRNRS